MSDATVESLNHRQRRQSLALVAPPTPTITTSHRRSSEPPFETPDKLRPLQQISYGIKVCRGKSGEGPSTHTRRVTKFVCEICRTNGHQCWDCPKRSQGMGLGCPYCYGPCKKKDDDPREHWSIEMVKHCVVCGKMGNHWADECPFWSDGDDDSGLSDDEGFGF